MHNADASQVPGVFYVHTDEDFPLLHLQEQIRTPLRIRNRQPEFVVQQLGTTSAFDSVTYLSVPQLVTCIPDPLGINGETLIGKRRAERPQSQANPAPPAEFEESTFQTLFPLFADPRNDWLLSALVEGITNPRILGWIYRQLDSIPDPPRVNNLKKKLLLNPDVPEDILFRNCIFCNVKPGQIVDSLGITGGVISIHNDYPFAPQIHKVFILQQRKHDISQITAEEIFFFYELMHKVALDSIHLFGDALDGFTYGMNYGLPRIHKGRQVIAAGASQPHLHSQVGALTRASYNAADRIGCICRAYKAANNRDYLADYLEALRNANLIIAEDDHAVLFVPVAQRFNYELQIMAKNPAIDNIRDTTPVVRKSLGYFEHLAYMIYQHGDINIQSFNTVMHATRFSSSNDYGQRLILSVYPRTTIMALSELAYRNVVDMLPWYAASKLRQAKDDLLTKGPRKLTVLAIGSHPDDIDLGCAGTIEMLKERGHIVHELIITDGSGGPNRSPEHREKEANAAARVLGIESVMFGRIRDGQAHAGDTLFNLISDALGRYNPDIVLCHASISSEHSDHKNVSEAARTVCEKRKIFPLMFEVPAPNYHEDGSFVPTIYVTFGEDVMKCKSNAILEHKSEIKRGTITVESALNRAKQRATEFGHGMPYAEAFTLIGPKQEFSKLLQWMPFASAGNAPLEPDWTNRPHTAHVQVHLTRKPPASFGTTSTVKIRPQAKGLERKRTSNRRRR
jgi:LmbE family N-acetylglucosaminyl deacetylase